VNAVLKLGLPTAVSTIYGANYLEPQGRRVIAALAPLDDVITRAAFAHGLLLLDLRLICSEPADYANLTEPSSTGGAKIAAAIARLVRSAPTGRSSIWT
jgi:hypothetical protein